MSFERELDKIARMRGLDITFGIHESEGVREHGDAGETIAGIGTQHEFGLGVPRRSFVRDFVDENDSKLFAIAERATETALRTGNPDALVEGAPLKMAALMQANFRRGIGPALSPTTIARKGSSLQLVDTGVLRSSITGKAKVVV